MALSKHASLTNCCLRATRYHIPPRLGHAIRSPRAYSLQTQEEELARLPDLNPQLLSVTQSTTPKTIIPPEELIFGRNFTGTMQPLEVLTFSDSLI